MLRLAALGLLVAGLLPAQDAPSARLSHSEVFGRAARAFTPRMESPHRWAPDGKSLRVRGSNSWIDPLTGEAVEPAAVDQAQPVGAGMRSAFGKALVSARPGTRSRVLSAGPPRSTLPRTPEPSSGMLTSRDGKVAIAKFEGELWAFEEGKEARRLLANVENLRHLRLAPDGETASFIQEHDLHLVNLKDGETIALSEDGGENLFYGELDWVYQEEVYGRFNFQAAWWAPNGDHLAFLRIDEEGVDTFTVIDHMPTGLKREELKYPKAGTTNPRATLHVARASDGKRVALDLSKYPAADEILIVRVGWTPEGDHVVFQVQNREQTWLDLNWGDPETGKIRTLFREDSEAWVNVKQTEPRWLSDGTFIWESERTGYNHLYHYERSGKLVRAITEGEWQVKGVSHLDEKAGKVWFTATEGGAINVNHYVTGLDGDGFTRLTQGPGTHRITWNTDRTMFLNEVSSFDNPGEQRICKADGTVVRVLTRAPMPAAAARYGMSLPELHSVAARDGYELDATVLKPIPFDEGKTYPVWIETYSGPNAPSVRNRWNGSAWHQFLAQQGIIVLQVNVRSASGRGQKHTATCYQRFGVQELEDIEDTVDWLVKNPWADADRVGITGWSYGGYMAAYALCRSDKFKLGIAGAGVFDWRNYDTIYTERYMRKPQNNEKGYELSSVMPHAEGLNGHLLIIHGTIDDNVHFQNAVQLVYALQKAGKDFEFMMYPKTRHGVRDRELFGHWRNLVWKTIQEHL